MAAKRYHTVKIGGGWTAAWNSEEDRAIHTFNVGGTGGFFGTKAEADAALKQHLEAERRKMAPAPRKPEPKPDPERIDTPDGRRYGACLVCGKMAWLYECYYCHEDDMCYDCLMEHKEDYHNIG